tara:strand:- start:335 stop:895 length:561 start_codon:yes stop_codon:yes gene_type:complete
MSFLKKAWDFIWNSNSIWSWILNVVLAFILVKFILYPGFGFLLQTSHPVVAVMSGSMEHNGNFDEWWLEKGKWYEDKGFVKEEIEWGFRNGFNKGDIMVLKGVEFSKIGLGDVMVYQANRKEPIIHRVVEIGDLYFQTKGDNNNGVIDFEKKIGEDQIIGKAIFRIPLLGWVKIGFVNLITYFQGG